jgi:hypothetical protein
MKSTIVWVVLSIGQLFSCRGEPDPGPVRSPAVAAPEEVVAYYRLRVEFSTTSDWSTLELLTPKNVLAMRVASLSDGAAGRAMNAELLTLNQSLESARADKCLTMKADYAVTAESADRPMEFLLQKGSINKSRVRIFQIAEGKEKFIGQQDHEGVQANNSGSNPLAFVVDLSPLKDTLPLRARVGLGRGERMRWEFYDPGWTAGAEGTLRTGRTTLVRPAPSPREAMIRCLEEAKSNGIEGFFFSWRGPGDDSDRSLKEMLEVAKNRGFWISIYLETPGQEKIGDELAYAIGRYGPHPATYKVAGQPLVVVGATETFLLEVWGRIFASLRDRGFDAVGLATGIRQDDFEIFFDPDDFQVFLYPGQIKTGLFFARKVRYYSLLKDDDLPPIWMTTAQPRFRRVGGKYRLIWDLWF